MNDDPRHRHLLDQFPNHSGERYLPEAIYRRRRFARFQDRLYLGHFEDVGAVLHAQESIDHPMEELEDALES